MDYLIDSTKAIYDIIDGEIVIIHLESGNYYHLEGSGALAWKLLAREAPTSQMESYFSAHYSLRPEEAAKQLSAFLGRLVEENLVIQQPAGKPPVELADPTDNAEQSYAPPTIDVFTDMQDFLLVDPIHEVDEHGLPKYTPPVIDDL